MFFRCMYLCMSISLAQRFTDFEVRCVVTEGEHFETFQRLLDAVGVLFY